MKKSIFISLLIASGQLGALYLDAAHRARKTEKISHRCYHASMALGYMVASPVVIGGGCFLSFALNAQLLNAATVSDPATKLVAESTAITGCLAGILCSFEAGAHLMYKARNHTIDALRGSSKKSGN